MKAHIERAPLLAALTRITGVVERKQTIPILGNVAVSAVDRRIILRGTDLDMEAVEIVAAEVSEPGETTVPADKLFDITRNADAGAMISLSLDAADPRMKVQSGRSRFNLPVLSIAEFPKFAADDLGACWSFPAKTLADMVSRVAFCLGDSSALNAFSGTYLKAAGAELHVVACRSSGIAIRREPAPDGAELSAILLPKATNQIARWLGDVEGECSISASGQLVRIEIGGSVLTTKVFDGQYVNYLGVLMEGHDETAQTDQDALKSAIKRVMIFGDAKARSVRLTMGDEAIGLQARDAMSGEGADEIAADYAGPAAEFLLHADHLQSALNSLRGDRVDIGFSPTVTPGQSKSMQVVVRAPSDPGMVVNLMQPRA